MHGHSLRSDTGASLIIIGCGSQPRGSSMARRTGITLSRSQRPVFPDRCASCGVDHPQLTDEASTAAEALYDLVLSLFSSVQSPPLTSFATVDVPLCAKCRDPVRRRRRVRQLTHYASLVSILVAMGDVSGWYRLPIGGGPLIGITLAYLVSSEVWGHYFPLPLELTAVREAVTYKFRDADYAREFAALNEPFGKANGPASPGRAATPLRAGEGPGVDAVRGVPGGPPDPGRGGRGSVPPLSPG
jgi:hypothetical protein